MTRERPTLGQFARTSWQLWPYKNKGLSVGTLCGCVFFTPELSENCARAFGVTKIRLPSVCCFCSTSNCFMCFTSRFYTLLTTNITKNARRCYKNRTPTHIRFYRHIFSQRLSQTQMQKNTNKNANNANKICAHNMHTQNAKTCSQKHAHKQFTQTCAQKMRTKDVHNKMRTTIRKQHVHKKCVHKCAQTTRTKRDAQNMRTQDAH